MLRPTRAGWCFFAIVFGVGFAALNTGNNLLYLVLSLMLAFLVLSGLLSESALRGIAVERVLPGEIFAGTDNPVLLRIHNRQRRVVSFAVVVEDQIRVGGRATAAGRCFALRIAPGQSELRRYALRPERRGALQFAAHRVSTRFPFGLFAKSLLLPAAAEALVYPEVESLTAAPRSGGARHDGESRPRRSGQGAEVSGLREFEPGDSTRRIHWKSSLRRGSLLVAEIDDERQAQIEVRLRTRISPDFEKRVGWAASEVVCHLEAGLPVALRTDHDYLPPATGPRQRARTLRFLALVEQRPDRGPGPATGHAANPAGRGAAR